MNKQSLQFSEWFHERLKALFSGGQPPTPAPPPKPPFVLPERAKAEAKEALHTLQLVDTSYGLGIWPTAEEKEKWLNDIAVFLSFRNLDSITLQLLGADKTVVAEVKICFGQHANGKNAGAPRGKEVPVIDRKLVAAHRVIVQHKNGNAAQYQHLLKFNWSAAETLRRRNGDEFANSQARKTAGRQTGSIFASKDSRHELIVTRPFGNKGFAFADCPSLKLTGVFLHERHLRGVRELKLGQRVTAQIIQLPDGLQAREVRAA
jgi:cold shock CspA family protein